MKLVLQIFMGIWIISMNNTGNQPGDWQANFSFSSFYEHSTTKNIQVFDASAVGKDLEDKFDFVFISDSEPVVGYIFKSYENSHANCICFHEDTRINTSGGFYSPNTRTILTYDLTNSICNSNTIQGKPFKLVVQN